jgi:hypothetical protein
VQACLRLAQVLLAQARAKQLRLRRALRLGLRDGAAVLVQALRHWRRLRVILCALQVRLTSVYIAIWRRINGCDDHGMLGMA